MFQFPFRFGFDMFPDGIHRFRRDYTCYSVSLLPGHERDDVEKGGKIIMPPSALEQLTRFNISYPMLFKITNPRIGKNTHCGVLEFVADENKIYIPHWMMRNLLMEEGEVVHVENVSLKIGTFAKFQPQTSDFHDISNPKAVLENSLRHFACLSKGDIIAIKYNNKIYELSVLETKPDDAVNIIECDMNVEFTQPLDYKEEESEKNPRTEEEDLAKLMPPPKGFVAFSGQASRLDGKQHTDVTDPVLEAMKKNYKRGIPDYNFKVGSLKFLRRPRPTDKKEDNNKEEFQAFSGKGTSLRDGIAE